MASRALFATNGAGVRSPAVALPIRGICSPPVQVSISSKKAKGDGKRRALVGSGAEGLVELESGGEEKKEQNETKKNNNKGWIHFVGIGGSGLSALAMLALKQGFEVSGSDIMWSSFMDQLHRAGVRLTIGHSRSCLEGHNGSGPPDAIVISSAIPADNEEILHAKSIGIPIYKRDDWLKIVTENYNLIAISGTHGKSTTAAMLSYVLEAMGDNPIAVVGANVPQFSGGNIIPGIGPNFVLEADEYDSCFLGLSPSVAVVTNVEWDHVDIFQDEAAVQNVFQQFVNQIRIGGHLILCGDSPGAYELLSKTRREIISSSCMGSASTDSLWYSITTYGLSNEYDWHASSITPNLQGGQDYVLNYKGCQIADIKLLLPGVHNVLNSLAVIATVSTLFKDQNCVPSTIDSVRYHLSTFEGVTRRFELIGIANGCQIYDDYAHHPTEVRAVLQAARQKFSSQTILVVFQPHTFSRLAALVNEFSTAFNNADYVIVTEIYAARETNNWNSHGRDLAALIRGPSSEYIPKLVRGLEDVIDKLVLQIQSDINQETVILTLGAGDITSLGPELLRRLQGYNKMSTMHRDITHVPLLA
ncbi:uncharacterized protein [Typha angustifolia]|uniref:uncharacterized protein isoform X2 n=1 Tax=Typha angustifolia TaxID=59011 RepID=UPI003C2CA1AD